LYGYFSGRFIFVAVAVATALAIVLRQTDWRRAVLGLAFAGVMCGALFAPMAVNIVRDWDYFNRRTTSVSIFTEIPGAETEPDSLSGLPVAWYNVKRNARAFILQDASVMNSGLWIRYTPSERPPLDRVVTVLFWAGLIVAATIRRPDTYTWWAFSAPLVIVEVFSRGTPDLARAIVFAPFYFLFAGLALDELFRRISFPLARFVVIGAAAIIVGWSGVSNVSDYFHWQTQPFTLGARLPGVDICEFYGWSALARDTASRGEFVTGQSVQELRQALHCSPVVFGNRFQGFDE
jgi:hypothetical protein